MARHIAILQSDFPYNIGARCINQEWFRIPLEEVWEIMSEELYLSHHYFNLQIHAFVLMSNHFHLVASTPLANLSETMRYFMSNTSRRLTEKANRINQTYGGRHFKCVLQSPNYVLNAYKYAYRNPVEAKICSRVEDYPYSTLYGKLGFRRLLIPIIEDVTLFSDLDSTLRWLNTPSAPEKWEAARWGLKRSYFLSKRSRFNNKPLLAEDDTL